jgi:hypothetical protein
MNSTDMNHILAYLNCCSERVSPHDELDLRFLRIFYRVDQKVWNDRVGKRLEKGCKLHHIDAIQIVARQ